MKKLATAALFFLCLGVAFASGYRQMQRQLPPPANPIILADLRQAQALMDTLAPVGYDFKKLPVDKQHLLYLPSVQNAEDPDLRQPGAWSFEPVSPFDPDYYPELVFICRVHYHENQVIHSETSSESSPSGGFIIGLRQTGKAVWAPQDQVEWRPSKEIVDGNQDFRFRCFPGMSCHSR